MVSLLLFVFVVLSVVSFLFFFRFCLFFVWILAYFFITYLLAVSVWEEDSRNYAVFSLFLRFLMGFYHIYFLFTLFTYFYIGSSVSH